MMADDRRGFAEARKQINIRFQAKPQHQCNIRFLASHDTQPTVLYIPADTSVPQSTERMDLIQKMLHILSWHYAFLKELKSN